MSDTIGPTFAAEIEAAGLAGLPFAWMPDGTILGRENLTTEQNSALDAVIAAHDPEAELPAPASPPAPVVSAMAMLTVADGVLSGINPPAFGLAMAFALGTGCYWLFFTEPQPDLNYSYNVTSSHGQVNVTARDTSFMEITVTESGSPIDPAEVSIQIFRVN